MSVYKLLMPQMGEGVIEATVISWLKNEGDQITEDETILEVATDKVDTEIQSPVAGIVKKINFSKDDIVPVGQVLALIETDNIEQQDDEIVKSISAGGQMDTAEKSASIPSAFNPYCSLSTI